MDSFRLYEYLQRNKELPRVLRDSAHDDETAARRSHRSSAHLTARHLAAHSPGHAGPLEGAGDIQTSVVRHESTWFDNIARDISTYSPRKQIVIGGVSGWASGYLFCKVGRVAALAIGGSIIILQIAQYQGLIQINWTNVERSFQSSRQRINEEMSDRVSGLLANITEFGRRHVFLAGSFCAGFLVGLAT